MKTKEHLLTGMWYVTIRETRVAGVWEREYEFAHGEWIIDFLPGGVFFEISHGDKKPAVRRWTANDATGIVSIIADPPESLPMKCVFDAGGPYLYYYDDLPHISENPAAIIEHHAHTRLKLAKTDK